MTRTARNLPALAASLAVGVALGGGAASPATASLREYTCYDLVQPVGAVLELRLWVRAQSSHDRRFDLPYLYAGLEVVLAAQGQGLRDQVAGNVLSQDLMCNIATHRCETTDARHRMDFAAKGDHLRLTVTDMPVGDFGNSMLLSNLAEPVGQPLRLSLSRAARDACPQSAHAPPPVRADTP